MGNKLKICVGAGYKFDFSISLINEQAFLILLQKKCQEFFFAKKKMTCKMSLIQIFYRLLIIMFAKRQTKMIFIKVFDFAKRHAYEVYIYIEK